ncbi:unnamed protein product [Ilex paraguariensis]|uniref:Uncharacterized protein n=1 Tax=Ilex paraguariensis TaxID=185542 RepID=A0ABC8S6J0_9AQUA
MAAGTCCSVAPFLFRKMPIGLEGKELLGTNKTSDAPNNLRENKSLTLRKSCEVAGNFITMTELKKKIMTFRDLLDLPPCAGSASMTELVIGTVKDLHKLYPKAIQSISMSETEATMHQALMLFCDALKSIGNLWTSNNEWMIKCKNDDLVATNNLEQLALAMLDDMIMVARERLFDMMDEDDQMKDESPPSNAFGKAFFRSYSEKQTPFSGSPATPTSVLPEMTMGSAKGAKICYSPPLLLPLRIQAVGKLSPIDVKRLSFHMFPHVAAQDSKPLIQKTKPESSFEVRVTPPSTIEADKDDELTEDIPGSAMPDLEKTTSEKGRNWSGNPTNPEVPTTDSSAKRAMDVLLPPPSLPKLRSNVAAVAPPPTSQPTSMVLSNALVSPPPLSSPPKLPPTSTTGPPRPPMKTRTTAIPPPPMTSANMATSPPPPPPPPIKSGNIATLPPPPLMMSSNRLGLLPPPVPQTKGGAPPPPPPALVGSRSLRPKKAATKLKRSSQMGNLYRLLKGKVEGSTLDGKSSSQGRKSNVRASGNGKQGMADALAEMTKRSAYFQQIEEDVRNHATSIKEVKVALSSFQTSDMAELIKFHRQVESLLEKLTDETQVLARFEDFPTKKLEALRMGAALHTKLNTIVTTLQNWKIVTPVSQLIDKVESYFNKIKGEMDTLERTKDEESKKFQSHKINFDFNILVRIKELMVDVSSSCMELALKERRNAKAKENEESESSKTEERKKGSAKMLWKAFQFAFRVYTFAGGHDDRADNLTKELAQEIETDPHH